MKSAAVIEEVAKLMPDKPIRFLVNNRTLHDIVQTLKLDVATIMPIHGKPVPWTDFMKVIDAPVAAPARQN